MTRRSAYGHPLCTWGDACRMAGTFTGPDGRLRCGIHRNAVGQLTLGIDSGEVAA